QAPKILVLALVHFRGQERVAEPIDDIRKTELGRSGERGPQKFETGRLVGEDAVFPLRIVDVADIDEVVLLGDVIRLAVEFPTFRGVGYVARTSKQGESLARDEEVFVLFVVRYARLGSAIVLVRLPQVVLLDVRQDGHLPGAVAAIVAVVGRLGR